MINARFKKLIAAINAIKIIIHFTGLHKT